jgi:hypothetical protein
MTSAATLAITACTDILARPDASVADLIRARTAVWAAADDAEIEGDKAERDVCNNAGAAVSDALEAAYMARQTADAPVTVATPDRATEILVTLVDLSARRDAARARWFAADAKSPTFAADFDGAQSEMDALSAQIAPLMEELATTFP